MFCDQLFDIFYMQALYVINVSLYFVNFFNFSFKFCTLPNKAGPLLVNLVFKSFSSSGVTLPFFLSSSSLSLQNLNRYRAFRTIQNLLLLRLLLVWFFALTVLFHCLQESFWFCVF